MKTLILKELRENVKLAVLGFGILTLILVLNAHGYSTDLKALSGSSNPQQRSLPWQPLVSSDILAITTFFCAIFGAVLGWFQIHNERHRDLWAFLIHRPATRTEIFVGKTIAGLTLYVLGAGLPLAGFIAWALAPGQVAAPFEMVMLWPVTVLFLSGIVYYFAGMLTGLRQARWYVSRALGLGLALIISLSLREEPYLGLALVFILIGVIVLATAVWGGFHSHGFYRGQPVPGKLALTGALMPGCGIVLAMAAVMSIAFLMRSSYSWSRYQMTKDGTLYKVTQENGEQSSVVDLAGKPLLDSKTGRMIAMADFNRRVCNPAQINLNFGGSVSHGRWLNRSCDRVFFWQATPDTLWYYWDRYRRLVGYDIATRRFIGSLGPDGFALDVPGDGTRFGTDQGDYYVVASRRIINTAQSVYELDLDHRTARTLFTVTNIPNETIGRIGEVSLNNYDWDYTLVVTRHFVHLLTPEGKVVWRADYKPGYPDYNQVQVAILETTNSFALWFTPSRSAQEKAGGKLPIRVTWLDRVQGVLKNTDLPDLAHYGHEWQPQEKLMSLSISPVLMVVLPLLQEHPRMSDIPWGLLWYSLAAALVCLPIGWWLGRRYSLALPACWGWAAFHLAFGIPGLLTFLCVQEWPAREPCPNCKKLRVVDREQCEHCGAGFAPPERNGTELFEPLVVTK